MSRAKDGNPCTGTSKFMNNHGLWSIEQFESSINKQRGSWEVANLIAWLH